MPPRLRPGKHGLLSDHSHLVAQYDQVASGGTPPELIAAGTKQKLWWSCDVADDHRWPAPGSERMKGTGCPACANHQVSVTNSLTRYPKLAAQFDLRCNGGRTPEQIIATTHEPLWWSCPVADDHRWPAPGQRRVNEPGPGCPACNGKQASVTNSLARFPALAAQFDLERNGGRTAAQVVAGTGKTLWWRCPVADDHRWPATGSDRLKGSGCPACAGLQVSVTNSLARFPELAAEFDIERNGGRAPEEVVAGTGKALWWICAAVPEHRWKMRGAHRLQGRGCPDCYLTYTSRAEIRLAAELASVLGLDVSDQRLVLPGQRAMRVDILDRQRSIVVEYDGAYWHELDGAPERDAIKTVRLNDAGFTVVRVRQRPLPPLGEHSLVVDATTSTHQVALAVLTVLAAARPDAVTTEMVDAYRAVDGPVADDVAEEKIASARVRKTRPRRSAVKQAAA